MLETAHGMGEDSWYTITDSFDKDFDVDEWHGRKVFFRDENDKIFRTYYISNRGDEAMSSLRRYLDVTPPGRQEDWEDSPEGYPKTPRSERWRWHAMYCNKDAKGGDVVDEAMAALKL